MRKDSYKERDKVKNIVVKEAKNKNRFTKINKETLQGEVFLSLFRDKFSFYSLLDSYIVRKPYDDISKAVYDKYYQDGFLACSHSTRYLADMFSYKDKRMILKWSDNLEKIGAVRIEKIKVEGYKKQNVYILGTYEDIVILEDGIPKNKRVESVFLDDLMSSKVLNTGYDS